MAGIVSLPEHRNEVLPALLAGEVLATWAVADRVGHWRPDGGVTAAASGEGLVLSGSKGLVHDAHVADWLLVGAATSSGPAQVLLPLSAPGMTVTELDGMDITRRFTQVTFDDVAAPGSSIVGDLAGMAQALDRQLQLAAVLTVAESAGAMERIFDVRLDYAKSRIAFGRPIGSFQAVKHLLADTSLLLEASKAVVAAAARSVQGDGDDAAEVASIAKAFVGDGGIELAQNCLQVLGGIGFTWEHDLHLYLRRLTADASLFGEPAWRQELVWHQILTVPHLDWRARMSDERPVTEDTPFGARMTHTTGHRTTRSGWRRRGGRSTFRRALRSVR